MYRISGLIIYIKICVKREGEIIQTKREQEFKKEQKKVEKNL